MTLLQVNSKSAPAKMNCNTFTLNIKIQKDTKCFGINVVKDICSQRKCSVNVQWNLFSHE